ncbi:MAG TPA: hypothetical protein PK468_25445, partial [Candidatus Hydrogenedentes bacterium]|nr:hypothetical protein [Candidatus Hydrogenedentota bacterium]
MHAIEKRAPAFRCRLPACGEEGWGGLVLQKQTEKGVCPLFAGKRCLLACIGSKWMGKLGKK